MFTYHQFNEHNFINLIIYKTYINNTNDFTNFIKEYTTKNSKELNESIIIRYATTIDNAIYIYEHLYKFVIINVNINKDELNYADLAYIILYHIFHDDILSKILENYLCSDDETDINYSQTSD